jgi:hypothetical protein
MAHPLMTTRWPGGHVLCAAILGGWLALGATTGIGAADEEPTLGFKPMPPEVLYLMPAPPFQVPTDMPASLDWTSQTTPAKNQSVCGGCWAFAATGMVEAMAVIQFGASTSLDLAEQFPLSCDTATHPLYGVANDGCCGGYVTVFDFLKLDGTLSESRLTFHGDFDGDTPRPGCTVGAPPWDTVPCPDPLPAAAAYRIDDWGLVRNDGLLPTVNELKARLQSGPIWLGFLVYADFMTYWNTASAEDVYVHSSGIYQGGHAVLLVGYDDAVSAWIVRNSWGATAGPRDDGTWLMSYTANCQFGLDAAWATVEMTVAAADAACCQESGSCTIATEADCSTAGGVWHEAWSTCSPNPCPQPAACCLAGDVCEVRLEADCLADAGEWHAAEADCSPDPCATPAVRPSWGSVKNRFSEPRSRPR